jgi:tetratricopeptide (TPR) repeat protein
LGDVFDEDVYMQHYRETKDVVFQSLIHRNKMYAACYFGEHEEGASLALTVGEEFLEHLPGQSACVLVTFANGLACYAMLRKTGERKYRRMAKRCRKRIKEWVKKGNPNCLHYEAFLDAEHKACKGQKLAAVHDYKVAIRFAGRRGILHDHALANERLGEFLLECGDFDEANYRFEKAVALYSEWGADSKVELLKDKIKSSLPFKVYLEATAEPSVLSLR